MAMTSTKNINYTHTEDKLNFFYFLYVYVTYNDESITCIFLGVVFKLVFIDFTDI